MENILNRAAMEDHTYSHVLGSSSTMSESWSALKRRDLKEAWSLANEIGACDLSIAQFGARGVAGLPRLVASELTTLSICDLRSGHRRVVSDPPNAIARAELAAFDRFFFDHPLVRFHSTHQSGGSHRISDSLSTNEFRRTGLYNEYYRQIGIDHVIAVPLYVDDGLLVSFVLNRIRRDFGERDRQLLDLLRVSLARLYRDAARMDRVKASLAHWRSSASEEVLAPLAGSQALSQRSLSELPLTRRERDVLRWVAAGKTNQDIAAILGASVRTIEKHLEHIYAKLGVETRIAAVMRALAIVTGAL